MPWDDREAIPVEASLVHNINNYVVMNQTANGLLALGDSPAMDVAIDEVTDLEGEIYDGRSSR